MTKAEEAWKKYANEHYSMGARRLYKYPFIAGYEAGQKEGMTTPPVVTTTEPIEAEAKAVCEWQIDDSYEGDTWDGDCGIKWTFMDGGPHENKVNYCFCCGKPIAVKGATFTGNRIW